MSFVLEIIQPISKRFIKSNVFQELFTFRRGTTLFHLSCCKFKRACLLLRESLCGLHVFSTVGKRAFRYSRNVVNLNNSNEEEGMKLDNISLARPSPVVKVLLLGKWWDRVKWGAFKKGVLYHGEDCNRGPKNDPPILEPAFLLVNRWSYMTYLLGCLQLAWSIACQLSTVAL